MYEVTLWPVTRLMVAERYFGDTFLKGESGRSPLDLIHETTVGTIRQQLRYSNKTIKEICTELDFPNLSFFGKFVKEHLGMSPTEYRQQNLNNECRLHPEHGKQT